jgi:CheY-like chemotaxis protein
MTQTTVPAMRRILVVEDEAIIARDIAMQLQDLGYDVLGPVASGEQALALARQSQPCLVLMDIHLAGAMDGISAAQAIRTDLQVPTIFLSAFNGDENLARAELAQPAGYMAKPFSEVELETLLSAVLKPV